VRRNGVRRAGWGWAGHDGVGRVGTVQGARVPSKIKKKYFPLTVKIRTSGYQTAECFTATLLCARVKLLTDLQICGCELHKNAFGGRAQPGPANRYKAEGKGRERLGGGGRKGKKGHEGVGRYGKGK